jgi:hypothetical protein
MKLGQSLASKQSTKTHPEEDAPVQTTVIEVPAKLKSAVEALVLAVQKAEKQASGCRSVDTLAVETAIHAAAVECERAALEMVVQAAAIHAPQIRVGGEELFAVGRFETEYMSAAGPLRVERALYRWVRNGPTFDPIAAKLGVVNKVWLPGAAAQMASLIAMGPSRDAEKIARTLGRLPYSRSSFERVGHAVGEHYGTRHAEIDEELIAGYVVPPEAAGIAVSLDRGTVPVEEPRPRPPGRPRKGAAKKPVARNFRMAYCGCITILDAEGKSLHKICYGRMPKGDPVDLVEGMASDVMALLEQRPDLHLTLLADGAPELWSLLDAQFNATQLGETPHRLIDLFHLSSKLGAAAVALYGEDEGEARRKRWHIRLENCQNAALTILSELRVADNGSDAVHDAITYLENNHDRMNYAKAKAEHRPLGSGAVEATCKSLLGLRMKRPGARWHHTTGEHIIQLRALWLSDRWAEAMALTLRPLRCTVHRAA